MKPIALIVFFINMACAGKNDTVQVASVAQSAENIKQAAGKFSYAIGAQQKSIDLKSLSVSINKETVDDGKGKTKSNSTLNFTIHDLAAKLSFRFHIKDENVVSEFTGEYALRNQGGFEEGESIRSTNVMIVNTENSSNSYFSMEGGSCTIKLQGSTLSVEIKNASVRQGEQIVPFSLSLKMDGVKVRNKLEQ